MNIYKPKGAIVPFLAAVATDPHGVWTATEAAQVMQIQVRKVSATLKYAVGHGVLYRSEMQGRVVYRGVPFDASAAKTLVTPKPRRVQRQIGAWAPRADEIRIPQVVPGWLPPKMVCVREGV
jgi:hypothetical protein